MPVQHMHAGEGAEGLLLWIVIPVFVVIMIFDIVKRRKLRREQLDAPPREEAQADEPPGPPSP